MYANTPTPGPRPHVRLARPEQVLHASPLRLDLERAAVTRGHELVEAIDRVNLVRKGDGAARESRGKKQGMCGAQSPCCKKSV